MAQTSIETSRRQPQARVLLAAVAVFLAVPCSVLAVLVGDKHGLVVDLDTRVARTLHQYALQHPGSTDVMKVISTIGSPAVWWLILLPVAGWLLTTRQWRLAAFVAVTAAGSPVLSQSCKHVVARARPMFPDPVASAGGPSFPSGHTLAATVGFGIVVLVLAPLVGRSLRVLLCVIATLGIALIGFSRLALGVHYLSDVVGAVIIAAAWLLAMAGVFETWRRD
ncbi:MAG TPA: phosphatase PAP2 family protein [Jatrophihabitantaceae bacterium]|jgi:undecaprenyl-diphosphatase|nr:phosphatase PAP2 family protein [Jatrophihabitantaceae bacterium]